MSTYDERIAALEKDAVAMKRDIIYKLDETNSAVTIIKGIVVSHGQDLKEIRYKVKAVNVHLDEIDIRLEGLKDEIRTIKAQQDVQGQGIREIRHQQDVSEEKFEQRFTSLEDKFAQVLQLLTTLRDKAE